MPPEAARTLIIGLREYGVEASVGGGWAVDALLGRQTRPHADLDVWAPAHDFEGLLSALAAQRSRSDPPVARRPSLEPRPARRVQSPSRPSCVRDAHCGPTALWQRQCTVHLQRTGPVR